MVLSCEKTKAGIAQKKEALEEGLLDQEGSEEQKIEHSRAAKYAELYPLIMGGVLLIMVIVVWMSPTAIWKSGAHSTDPFIGGSTQLAAETGGVDMCQRSTGGTCFIFGCAEERGNTSCDVVPGLGLPFGFQVGWHSCNCLDLTPCAHSDGKCYSYPEQKWNQWFRGESEWTVGLAFAPIMRSGVTTALNNALDLDHLMGVPKPGRFEIIDYNDVGKYGTWEDVFQKSHFTSKIHAIIISAVKLVGLHVAQPMLFIIPYMAFSSSMGWWQYSFATVVVTNELWYLIIIAYGMYRNRWWLLYGPLSDKLVIGDVSTTTYFVAPSMFISSSLYRRGCLQERVADFSALLGVGASASAFIAMIIGLFGQGVMWPSLFIGYAFSAMEIPGLVLASLFLSNRELPEVAA